MGCLLGANLGPTWRPRRLQDEPEAEKKGDKNGEKSRFMLGAAQSSKMTPTQNDKPDLTFGGLPHRFWKVFGPIFGSLA